jgi:hypothetical protein
LELGYRDLGLQERRCLLETAVVDEQVCVSVRGALIVRVPIKSIPKRECLLRQRRRALDPAVGVAS